MNRWRLGLLLAVGGCVVAAASGIRDASYAPWSLTGADTTIWIEPQDGNPFGLLIVTEEPIDCGAVSIDELWEPDSFINQGKGLLLLLTPPSRDAWEILYFGSPYGSYGYYDYYDTGWDSGGSPTQDGQSDQGSIVALAWDEGVIYSLDGYRGGGASWARIDDAGSGQMIGEFVTQYWSGDFRAERCGQ